MNEGKNREGRGQYKKRISEKKMRERKWEVKIGAGYNEKEGRIGKRCQREG